ncbi:MAG: outer membrane lipoprotein-sorting protein [Flavobacteriaceae bacterium]|nr:outer membrane lipoprotein-sorting protein [Flavobacteriaceae bacterium]|tara:strand:- start:1549 stop:2298 length:750 start_codon:yes stop_codon:yes gene_type:complete
MKKKLIILLILIQLPYLLSSQQSDQEALNIIEKIDKNMFSKTQIVTSEMIVYGKRKKRVIRSKGYSMGKENNFTEYLSPEREKGTKMLKLDNRLWIYSPGTDRTIQLSGHLLRQSVMGSDLSYEDMMEERKLSELYDAKIVKDGNFNDSPVWIMDLISKVEGLAYHKRTLWIDKTKFVPLKENLYAKSGTLLKTTTFFNIKKIDTRWYPMKINYKDMLKDGKGTDFVIIDISFDTYIPKDYFSKNMLKK